MLRRNAAANGLANLSAHRMGLGARDGERFRLVGEAALARGEPIGDDRPKRSVEGLDLPDGEDG